MASREAEVLRQQRTEEYRLRAKLLERLEGFIGADDGFCSLGTATLRQLVYHLTGDEYRKDGSKLDKIGS